MSLILWSGFRKLGSLAFAPGDPARRGRRPRRSFALDVERLEDRSLLSAGSASAALPHALAGGAAALHAASRDATPPDAGTGASDQGEVYAPGTTPDGSRHHGRAGSDPTPGDSGGDNYPVPPPGGPAQRADVRSQPASFALALPLRDAPADTDQAPLAAFHVGGGTSAEGNTPPAVLVASAGPHQTAAAARAGIPGAGPDEAPALEEHAALLMVLDLNAARPALPETAGTGATFLAGSAGPAPADFWAPADRAEPLPAQTSPAPAPAPERSEAAAVRPEASEVPTPFVTRLLRGSGALLLALNLGLVWWSGVRLGKAACRKGRKLFPLLTDRA